MNGQTAKQLGLDLVESHGQTFVQTMRGFARMHCRNHGSVTSDDVREKAEQLGLEPHHQNAWGAIFRGSDWVELNFEPSTRPGNHGRTIRRWTLKELAA